MDEVSSLVWQWKSSLSLFTFRLVPDLQIVGGEESEKRKKAQERKTKSCGRGGEEKKNKVRKQKKEIHPAHPKTDSPKTSQDPDIS